VNFTEVVLYQKPFKPCQQTNTILPVTEPAPGKSYISFQIILSLPAEIGVLG